MNLKDKILASFDCKGDAIEVPEWNTKVYIKQLSMGESIEFQSRLGGSDENDTTTTMRNMVAYVAKCLCDEEGNRIFGDEDEYLLETRSSAVIQRLFGEAVKANSLNEDNDEIKKD